ncbi:MAG: dienelactone hydrolase family protein [Steroidobacteraceae bacterium]
MATLIGVKHAVGADNSIRRAEVAIATEGATLRGALALPTGAAGIVLFSHGSGSSRLSPRNTYVAERLYRAGCATLLFDLLTAEEEERDTLTATLRFDIPLLTKRLVAVTHWTQAQPRLHELKIGYFGASTGAAAALIAAARVPGIAAMVSRGGRPDLAGAALVDVLAPTLLIVGGNDRDVLALNRQALAHLRCEARLVIVPEATHLFEEPGALEQVASLAATWFTRHFGSASPAEGLPR